MAPSRPGSRKKPPAERGNLKPATLVGLPNFGDSEVPLFSFEHADHEYEGNWSWPSGDEASRMLRFIVEISQKSWAQIRLERFRKGKYVGNPCHHEQAVNEVGEEAQARLVELGHDHLVEFLYRFGVSPRRRLWGFATDGVFYVLWWDGDHKVFPVDGTFPPDH